jgi:acyl-CoA synthetase (AMP-forming)/AMP-acid ligase II/acyl carrier protein
MKPTKKVAVMYNTIIEYLHHHAETKPDDIAFRFLNDAEQATRELTFKELWFEALSVAEFLKTKVKPGDRVMLFYPPGMDYVIAFYGCLLAGVIAVPLYPPRKNKKSDRIIKVAQSCQSVIALTTRSEAATVKACWAQQNHLALPLEFFTTDNSVFPLGDLGAAIEIAPTSPAFLQYTSGSTGTPKGVIITHENIIANVKHLSQTSTGNKDDVFVNWLPLFHDLGLVTAILWPVFLGAPSMLMAPATFIRDPLSWLKAISRYKGTMCGAPNFAYDLCVNKISDEHLAGLDLSSWRVAYNAAEPVKAKTLEDFYTKFSSTGFKSNSFYPCYGMAEATVCVTGGQAEALPKVLYVNKQKFAEHTLEIIEEANELSTSLVGCGIASAPHYVKIVDPVSREEVADGQTGEIWFSGPSVSPGYWQLDEVSTETFNQKIVNSSDDKSYLRTGDFGVKWQSEFYVTGRIKDLIIIHGTNYYPQDIEESVADAHVATRQGYSAAFSVTENDIETLTVVTELSRSHFRDVDTKEVVSAIRKKILDEHEVKVSRVVLLKPYSIPVTSSGKIQRKQTKKMLLNSEFVAIGDISQFTQSDIVAPITTTEIVIHKIWSLALAVKTISTEANFFDIGGDSVTAIEISSEIKVQFSDFFIDVEYLLELATIKEMALFIDLQKQYSEKSKASDVEGVSRVIRI